MEDEGSDGFNERLLSANKVWTRYGITPRTLDRWLEREDLGFPQPAVVIARRRYWRLQDLERWEASRAASERKAA
jgi:predicted DNA-binding transcriptional regulator AlpA